MKGIRFNGPKMTKEDAVAYAKFVREGKSKIIANEGKDGMRYSLAAYPYFFHNQVSRRSDNPLYKEIAAISYYMRCCRFSLVPFYIHHPYKGFRWWRKRTILAIDWYWGWVDERKNV